MIGLLVAAGVTCVGVFAIGQRHAPQPALSAAQPLPTAGWVPARHGVGAAPTVQWVPAVAAGSLPVTIRIAAIGVRSTLQQVGQNADGSLQVPAPGPRYGQPGWYRYSPTPGSIGPAVIVGHLDSAADGPSVFFRLGALRAGDTVVVGRADGSTVTFVVDSVGRYLKTSFPTRLVYGDTATAALRLITCGGALSATTGHYLDNIVVLATMVRIVSGPAPLRPPGA